MRIIALWFLAAGTIAAQSDTISLNQLQDCVRERYRRSLDAELEALKYDKKGEWVKYLPNLGITYTVAGEPRPAVSTSTNVFYQAQRDKKTREAAKNAAFKQNQLAMDTELSSLARMWRRYMQAKRRAETYNEIEQIDRDLFLLYQKQYEAKEILPEVFLTRKKAFLLQELRRQEEQEELLSIWFQIVDKAGCLTQGA